MALQPTGDSKFTVQQRMQIEEKLLEFKPVCPICHTQQWLYGDSVRMSSGGIGAYPMLPLICSVCGNTQFINLRVLGISGFALVAGPPYRDRQS